MPGLLDPQPQPVSQPMTLADWFRLMQQQYAQAQPPYQPPPPIYPIPTTGIRG